MSVRMNDVQSNRAVFGRGGYYLVARCARGNGEAERADAREVELLDDGRRGRVQANLGAIARRRRPCVVVVHLDDDTRARGQTDAPPSGMTQGRAPGAQPPR